jgi:hypothetical protein
MKRNNNQTVSSVIPDIDVAASILYAPESETTPQTKDEKGQVIRGTALAVYMGYKNSMIEWVDETGKERSVPKLALIFAVKLQNGSFKNIPVKTSYAVSPGTSLEQALKAMGVNPEYEKVVQDKDDEMFGTITKLKREKLESDLDALKGLAFLTEIENKISKNGRYYSDIDLDTIQARKGKNDKHMRVVAANKCDVSAIKINFNED